jgi:hypothetical protein
VAQAVKHLCRKFKPNTTKNNQTNPRQEEGGRKEETHKETLNFTIHQIPHILPLETLQVWLL